jgi:hypothetical protein
LHLVGHLYHSSTLMMHGPTQIKLSNVVTLSCTPFTAHSSIPVNKANSMHNLFLVYLSISTCFGRLFAHRQEKQLYLCDTWYLLFCVDDCLVCRVAPCRPDSHTKNKYIKNKLCTELAFLQEYTGMHGQQNIKHLSINLFLFTNLMHNFFIP